LSIKVAEDVVTLDGLVAEQVDAEKIAIAVGNVEGVASVNNNLEVEIPKEEATYHTVVSGDTLSKIAKEVYGNAMKYPVIFEANKPMLSDPDKIYPGQVLRIPALEA
jgi:nucleoid-associated protein YgaU